MTRIYTPHTARNRWIFIVTLWQRSMVVRTARVFAHRGHVCVYVGSGCFFGYLKQRRNTDVWSEFIVWVMLPLTVREWEICENWKSDTVVIRCVKKKEWIHIKKTCGAVQKLFITTVSKKRIKHGKKKDIIARRGSGVRVRMIKESIQVVEEKSEREKQNIKKLIGVTYLQKTRR